MKIEKGLLASLFLLIAGNAYCIENNCIDVEKTDREVIMNLLEKGIIKKTEAGYLIDPEYVKAIQMNINVEVEEVGSDTICR